MKGNGRESKNTQQSTEVRTKKKERGGISHKKWTRRN